MVAGHRLIQEGDYLSRHMVRVSELEIIEARGLTIRVIGMAHLGIEVEIDFSSTIEI